MIVVWQVLLFQVPGGLVAKIDRARARDLELEVRSEQDSRRRHVRVDGAEVWNGHYSEKTDVWAFGMVIYGVITRQMPHAECASEPQVIKRSMNGELPDARADPGCLGRAGRVARRGPRATRPRGRASLSSSRDSSR